MGWTSERMETLRAMWTEGKSAREIAMALGEVTRNAVMGKIHRMGLMGNGEHNTRMKSVPRGACRPRMPVVKADDPNVVRISSGTIARTWTMLGQTTDWRDAFSFVKDLTGRSYDPSRHGHRAAVVAISTILGRGDPRRILVPQIPEPTVLQVMRSLAEKGFVVGGKTPERWRAEEGGDMSFFEDMLIVENVRDRDRLVLKPMAA